MFSQFLIIKPLNSDQTLVQAEAKPEVFEGDDHEINSDSEVRKDTQIQSPSSSSSESEIEDREESLSGLLFTKLAQMELLQLHTH